MQKVHNKEKLQHPIIILGEALVDFYCDSPTIASPNANELILTGNPGGAPANVAANLANMSIPVSLISSFSDDLLGAKLMETLQERNIDLSLSQTHPHSKSPLAIVMNSPEGDRSFRLYLIESALEQINNTDFKLPLKIDFLHFGSILLIFEGGVEITHKLLKHVKTKNTIRSYDINIRPDVLLSNREAPQQALDVLKQVDILKISDDDLMWIKEHVDPSLQAPQDYLRYGIKLIAYTEGAKGATLLTTSKTCAVPPPQVNVVDTTGGGDAFMAGILSYLYEQKITNRADLAILSQDSLHNIGAQATKFAGRILSQSGAMPPL